jgi:hypothetical protein
LGRFDDCCVSRNVKRLSDGVAGIAARCGISNRRDPGRSQCSLGFSFLPSERGSGGHCNCTGNAFDVRMSDFGAQACLTANDIEGLVGEECTERRNSHRRSVPERAHAAESDLGKMAPVEPVSHSAEDRIGALAVTAIELHSFGKTFSQLILINAAALSQNFNDGQGHLGIVSICPRRIGKDAPRNSLPDLVEWSKKSLTEGVANG